MRMHALILGLVVSGASCAATPVTTPKQVSVSLAEHGAQAFFTSLDEPATDKLFERISSGQGSWVALAPKLAPGADGANAEGLGIALAYALPKNATAVLESLDPVEGDGHILAVSRICGIPFIDEPPPHYKRNAIVAVKAVKKPDLRLVKARCLAKLRTS